MIVKQIQLRNFRNFEKADISWGPQLNWIVGNNAQGKTNLLESFVYLSLTRSHRVSDDTKLIRHGCPFAKITCTYQEEKEKKLEAILHPTGKTLSVQGVPVKKSSEFVGQLNVVLFAPDDLRLYHDSPRERRRILNQEITKISNSYLLSLNRYQHLLKDRNILLKRPNVDLTYLNTLDAQMRKEAIPILQKRKKFLDAMNAHLSSVYQELSGQKATASLQYQSCIDLSASSYEEAYQKMQEESRERDKEARVTTCGIHREDMIFLLDERNVVDVASQGQKRMVMLAFKYSLLKVIEELSHRTPVLLLDDVLSELDMQRQKQLIDMIQKPYQCFITTAELPNFVSKTNANFYTIQNGHVSLQGRGNQ